MSAKELSSLIMDEERLRAERANRGSWKSRVTGLEDFGSMEGYAGGSETATTPKRRERRQRAGTGNNDDEDLEYRLALEASKNEAEAEAARRKGPAPVEDDDDLAKAIRLSKEEEELRKRELEDQNSNLLFDDTPAQAPQPTGFNNGYQQQAPVDWFGEPIGQQQQPQNTGFLNNAYGHPTGLQNQQTGFQNGYGGGFGQQQPQQTGYEQMQQPQQQFMQPQQTAYNPWANQTQQNGFGQQQQPIQEQPTAQPGSNNPWATSTPTQNLQAQPTGSNNPFASAASRPQPTAQRQPTLSTLQEQKTSTFNPIQNYQAPQQTYSSPQTPVQPQHTQDPYAAKLNSLLGSGEGQDTFGNVGNLRMPAQHTAPGTFVNSAGAGSMGRLEASRTGHNPFQSQPSALQNQYTGMPSQQFPAQTGPAGAYGSANPFGQRQQQNGQSGSLIDL